MKTKKISLFSSREEITSNSNIPVYNLPDKAAKALKALNSIL